MGAALNSALLPPEAMALIKEGTPKSVAPLSIAPSEKHVEIPPTTEDAQAISTPAPVSVTKVTSTTHSESPVEKLTKAKPLREKIAVPPSTEALVSMTFRIPASVPTALLRASSERKIRRERPFTQQEIVTEALGQWLNRNGFGPA